MVATTWLKRHREPSAPARLVAYSIPPVGAGAAAHSYLADLAPSGIDLLTVRLPGREKRRSEPPLETVDRLVSDVVPKIRDHVAEHGLPFAVLGDCATSLLAFEVGRALERAGDAAPCAVVAVNCRSPQYAHSPDRHRLATSRDLRAEAAKCAAVPPEISGDPEVFALFEPTVRADLNACESYRWDGAPLTAVPIWALVPADRADLEEFASWRTATRARAKLVPVQAGRHRSGIVDALAEILDAYGVAAHEGWSDSFVRQQVVGAWVSILPESAGQESEGFFDVDGDSIAAVRLRNALISRLGESPPLTTILRGVTLGELIEEAAARAAAPASAGEPGRNDQPGAAGERDGPPVRADTGST